jgi:hypothetical protein
MDRNNVLQGFKEIDTEATTIRDGKSISFAAEFRALGKEHSYHFGYDYDSDRHLLVVAGRDAALRDALNTGTLIDLGKKEGFDAGYNRALLIERAMIGGLPLEDSIRLTGKITDYDALEQGLGEQAVRPEKPTPGLKPSIEMTLQKR